ncbi:MAG: hypothetical protein AAFY90_15300 [Pseudomonadota bacterium]
MTWSTAKMVMLSVGIALAFVIYSEAKADLPQGVTDQDRVVNQRD